LFERLYAFRRREGLANWEATIERLLPQPNDGNEVAPVMETKALQP
jgi:hypothetical protein